jgi:hypothetical protein
VTDLWLGLAGWAIASGALLIVAVLLAHALRLGRACLDLPAIAFLWIFLATLLVMILGLAGVLRPAPVLIATGIALLAAVMCSGLRESAAALSGAAETLAGLARALRREWIVHPVLVGGALLFAALLLTRAAAHIWFLPPYVWDALIYHLPNVAEWVQRGHVGLIETPTVTTRWPANHELLQAWFVLFPHHDVLVDAATVPAWFLASGATYAIARGLGVGRSLAAVAALTYAATPAVALHAASVNNDLPIAAAYLFGTALLLHLGDRTLPAQPAGTLLFLTLSLALGTKAYIAFLSPGLVVIALLALRRRRASAEPTGPGLRARRVPRGLLAGLLAAGFLLGSYWYLRNLVVFGNPFSPTDFRVFGHLVFGTGQGVGQRGSFSGAALLQSLRMLPGKLLDAGGPYNPDLLSIAGWGWFGFGVGIPTLAYALILSGPLRWLAVAFGTSFLSLLAWVNPDRWNLRFAIWFPALLAVGFAVALGETRSRLVRRGLLLLAASALLLNVIGTLTAAQLTPARWALWLQLPVTERSSAAHQALIAGEIGPGYARALELVSRDAVIGYHIPPSGILYPLYGADLSRRLRYVPVEPGASVTDEMDRRGVRYLFTWRLSAAASVAIEQALATGTLVQLAPALYARRD